MFFRLYQRGSLFDFPFFLHQVESLVLRWRAHYSFELIARTISTFSYNAVKQHYLPGKQGCREAFISSVTPVSHDKYPCLWMQLSDSNGLGSGFSISVLVFSPWSTNLTRLCSTVLSLWRSLKCLRNERLVLNFFAHR